MAGDLNVDLDDDKPGADVLSQLIYRSKRVYTYRPQLFDPDLDFGEPASPVHVTYMRSGNDPGSLRAQLDYFLVSKKLCIDSYFPYAPKSYYAKGPCVAMGDEEALAQATEQFQEEHPGLVLGKRFDEANRQYCFYGISKTFDKFRDGSDHLPVLLKFHTRNEDKRCD